MYFLLFKKSEQKDFDFIQKSLDRMAGRYVISVILGRLLNMLSKL